VDPVLPIKIVEYNMPFMTAMDVFKEVLVHVDTAKISMVTVVFKVLFRVLVQILWPGPGTIAAALLLE